MTRNDYAEKTRVAKQSASNKANQQGGSAPRLLLFRRYSVTLLSLAAVVAVSALVACLLADHAQVASAAGRLIISEIVSSNGASLTDAKYGSPDWIELHNDSDSDICLKGSAITRSINDTGRHVFGDVTIPAGGYLVVYADEELSDSDMACTGFSLSRDGESIYLMDAHDAVLQHLIIPEMYPDVSYALSPGGSYGFCLTPTPGAANETEIGTLDNYKALAQTSSVKITEVMPNTGDSGGWIELYNAGDADARLGLYCLSDNADDTSPWRLSDSLLGPGQYALVQTANDTDGLSVPFGLGANDRGVYLTDITGNLRSALTWSMCPGAGTSVVAADTYTQVPTPGAANSADTFHLGEPTAMDGTDPIHISEVLTNNVYSLADADGDHNPWVEVCNTSDSPQSLQGYYLSDNEDDLLKWAFPDTVLEPGSFTLVFLSGKAAAHSGLHASFQLSADERALCLTDTATMHVDTFTLPSITEDDISFGHSGGGTVWYVYPTPGSANANSFESPADALQSRTSGVCISEVSAAGSGGDWIELYNGSGEAMDLSGWYLSDSVSNPLLWQIPPLQIPAGGYAVIAADSGADSSPPFSIAVSGETIILTRSDGALIDAMPTGALRAGLTSGRLAGETAHVFFSEPTPGAANSAQTLFGYAPAPVFSQSGLYCSQTFLLTITTPAPDAAIHYTLDGSAPDETDELYTGPISIDDNAVVRAVACVPGFANSDITTETYLFETPHTVPVFCLSGDPAEMNTILKKSTRKYKPEYAASVEFYETDGTLGVSFPAGLKAKGRGSLDYPQKSVTIKLRGKYGLSAVTYPFFSNGDVVTFSELTLRNGGQDIYGTLLRDSFFQTLAQGMNVDSIRTRFVAVYLNGRYWGLYSLDEEQEEGYFEAYYGVGCEDIDLIDRNETVMEGSSDDFLQVRHDARTWNLADDAVFAEFAKRVDVDACMDYLILNCYFANGDVINQRFWHTRDGTVKWRPLLFDIDWGMRDYSADRNSFRRYFSPSSKAGNETVTYMDIFYGLKTNKAWCDKFIDRFIELAYTNFDTDRMLAVYDEMVAELSPEMPLEIDRWHTHSSLAAWQSKADLLRRGLEGRRDAVLKQMASEFSLSGSELKARVEAYIAAH